MMEGMTDSNAWPTAQEYSVKIPFDHGMESNQPHAVLGKAKGGNEKGGKETHQT